MVNEVDACSTEGWTRLEPGDILDVYMAQERDVSDRERAFEFAVSRQSWDNSGAATRN